MADVISSLELEDPELIDAAPLTLVGLARKHAFANPAGIAAQWRDVQTQLPGIADALRPGTYGVIHDPTATDFVYLAGVAVTAGAPVPTGLSRMELTAQRYAVFRHPGHVTAIPAVCDAIWSRALPQANLIAAAAPWFEFYPSTFDPETGAGGFEIWIPLQVAG